MEKVVMEFEWCGIKTTQQLRISENLITVSFTVKISLDGTQGGCIYYCFAECI
jgi:hypothetical protein